jgi:hypothetical protein
MIGGTVSQAMSVWRQLLARERPPIDQAGSDTRQAF